MITVICIVILVYWIMGKEINQLLDKVKDVDWKSKINEVYIKIQPYALKTGRVAARPLLQFYHVMRDEKTSTLDRVLIYAAIIYTVSPLNLLPVSIYKLLGVLDEGAAVLYVYKKIKDKITPEINARVEETLNEWFGCEYVVAES